MIAGDIAQLARALQHVGKMAQEVFVQLGGGVRHVGEKAEGGHIGKQPPARLAHVDGPGCACARPLGQFGHGLGKLQRAGKVVGGAGGNVAQSGAAVLRQGQQAAHRLIQCRPRRSTPPGRSSRPAG